MASELFMILAACLLLGGVLLLARALFHDRSRGRRRCPKCWYDMSATPGLRCPECGREAKRETKLFKTRRRWRWALASMLVFIGAGFVAIQPKVQREGWGSVMPKTVLVLALRTNYRDEAFAALDKRTRIEWTPRDFILTNMVPHASTMWSWQWRMLADACIHRLHQGPMPAEHVDLLQWMSRALSGLSADDFWRVYAEMLPSLDHEDPNVRASAALYCAVDDGRYLDAIRRLMHDDVSMVRWSAVTGLRLLGRHSRAPTPLLVEALQSDDAKVRMFAAAALGFMASRGTEDGDEIFAALAEVFESDSDSQARAAALSAMLRFKSHRITAIGYWRQAVDSPDAALRAQALWTAADDSTFDEELNIEKILQNAAHESRDVREPAAWILHNRVSSERLRDRVASLQRLASADDVNVRDAAEHHLFRLGQPLSPDEEQ